MEATVCRSLRERTSGEIRIRENEGLQVLKPITNPA
jgi:hypothetical protein